MLRRFLNWGEKVLVPGLHLIHAGAVDEGAFVDAFGGQLLLVPFLQFEVDGFLFFVEDGGLLLLEVLQPHHLDLEGAFEGLLQHEVLDGRVVAL